MAIKKRRSKDRKICRFCKKAKKNLMISVNSKCKDWTIQYFICRGCNADKHAEWWKTHKEKQLEYNRKYLLKKKITNQINERNLRKTKNKKKV